MGHIIINVRKSGIMHKRRTTVEYVVDGELIPRVSSYKYLGCVVGEHLELREVLKEKTAAGKKALGDG